MKKLLLLAMASLILLTACTPAGSAGTAHLIAGAVYPQMAPYPDESAYINQVTGEFDHEGFSKVYDAWEAGYSAQYDQPAGYADSLNGFLGESIPALLTGADGENIICSPLNIYMALAMLAETTGGDSRQQILELLGADSIKSLRTQAGHVWNAHYCADSATSTVLANSLWLNEGVHYNPETIQTLADSYYASVYQGALGSAEMNKALQDWLNEQTGGLLEESAQNVEMDPATILALASTVYYRAKWAGEFLESFNTEGIFHSSGGDRDVTFMNKTLSYGPYYWGSDYAAAYLDLEDGSRMWLILPDEDKSPSAVLESGEALDMILNSSGTCENRKQVQINLSIPKFDVVSDIELNETLKTLGITDVFNADDADFTPILPEAEDAWLDSVQHAARVAIDEEGVAAAAYTVMMVCGAAEPPKDEVDLILDRPFVFVITSRDNLPLFAGVVNTP